LVVGRGSLVVVRGNAQRLAAQQPGSKRHSRPAGDFMHGLWFCLRVGDYDIYFLVTQPQLQPRGQGQRLSQLVLHSFAAFHQQVDIPAARFVICAGAEDTNRRVRAEDIQNVFLDYPAGFWRHMSGRGRPSYKIIAHVGAGRPSYKIIRHRSARGRASHNDQRPIVEAHGWLRRPGRTGTGSGPSPSAPWSRWCARSLRARRWCRRASGARRRSCS